MARNLTTRRVIGILATVTVILTIGSLSPIVRAAKRAKSRSARHMRMYVFNCATLKDRDPAQYGLTKDQVALKVTNGEIEQETQPPPWRGIAPPLPIYRERGHRRLAARTYEKKCTSCIWGCQMAVEMIIDQWNPSKRRYRTETSCYGPRSCPLYRSGPARDVPGRRGMKYTEEDWIDDEATSHRGPDE